MLHDWVKSEESLNMYRQLLACLQGPVLFHELVLSLAALLLIYGISHGFQPTELTPRESLKNLDGFVNGHFAIKDSGPFLFNMLWTCMWKLSSEVQSSASNALVQLLHDVVDIPRPLPEVVHESQDSYWKVRALFPVTHNMAMARFWDRSRVKDIKGKDSRTCCNDLLGGLTSWFSEALESFEGAEAGWGIQGRRIKGKYLSSLD